MATGQAVIFYKTGGHTPDCANAQNGSTSVLSAIMVHAEAGAG